MFTFSKMTQREAEEIANHWKYPGKYAFYDATADPEDYAELIDPRRRGDGHFSAYMDQELAGFYCVEMDGEKKAELGLGLRPGLTGRGYGLCFVNGIMAHIASRHAVAGFTLSVALFNRRAVSVYKRAGFAPAEVFEQHTNGGVYEFLRMRKRGGRTSE